MKGGGGEGKGGVSALKEGPSVCRSLVNKRARARTRSLTSVASTSAAAKRVF